MYARLSVRPQMVIRPQLVIAGKLLRASGTDLHQLINNELANNPALQLVRRPDYQIARQQQTRSGYNSFSYFNHITRKADHLGSFEDLEEHIAQFQSPIEKLIQQVSVMIDKTDLDTAIFLLHSLDHRGFLIAPTEDLTHELGISKDEIERVVKILHQLDPPGIGAKDVRECFLIQCAHLEAEGIDCQKVRCILTMAWDDFLNCRWNKVARKINEPKRVVEEACKFIRLNFYPYPLAILETSNLREEILNFADLIVLRDNRINPPDYVLQIPGEEDFELKITLSFQEPLGYKGEVKGGLPPEERTWIRTHVERAWVVMDALRQRWETLRQIGEYLIRYQEDFLERGPLYLKPLTRTGLAQELGLHESTVSRAVRDKNIQLPNGRLIPLSDLFKPSHAAKEAIRLLSKDKSITLCDREIATALQAKGIKLSRRTITKYRQEINIESSHRRQSIGL